MKVVQSWDYSLETEAKRLLHTAHQLAIYFYQTNGFIVLPQATRPLPDQAVVFPELPYHTIPRFFQRAKKINVDTPLTPNLDVVAELTELLRLANVPPEQTPAARHLQQQWQKQGAAILETLNDILPQTSTLLSHLTIHPTRFGTRQSFNRLYPNKTELTIFVRFDATLATIAESIASALTRHTLTHELEGTWSEAEMVVDWLVSQTKLAKLVGTAFVPTVKSLRSPNHVAAKKAAAAYIARLGFPGTQAMLTHKANQLYHLDTPLKGLTQTQTQVLSCLVQKRKLSTDELADLLFASEESYSLYALAKFVQRLRDKLEDNGITGSVIQTARGFGYELKE